MPSSSSVSGASSSCMAMMSACASAHRLAISPIESLPPRPTQRWTLYVINRNRDTTVNVEQLPCKVDVSAGMHVALVPVIMSEPKKDAQGDTTGEGNYDASRRYREGLEKSVEKGDSSTLGEKA